MIRKPNILPAALFAGALCLAVGCTGQPPATSSSSAPIPPLSGQVLFPVARRTQALITDVANASTVSLIDTTTNSTVATTITNASGSFFITPPFPNGFVPTVGNTYVLEAAKGLYSNAAGRSVARVRTILKYQLTGWLSITNGIPGAITVYEGTTALAAIANLKGSGQVAPTSLIGMLQVSPENFTPVTNVSGTEFTNVKGLVTTMLASDSDPVAGVAYDLAVSRFFYSAAAGILSIDQASASVGDLITFRGAPFSQVAPLSTNNVVTFSGGNATASVASASLNYLSVIVPAAAVSGPVTVRIGAQVYGVSTFTVMGTLNAYVY